MQRLISIGIVGLWVALIGVFIRSNVPRLAVGNGVGAGQAATGESWMGVYHLNQKIGYTRESLQAESDGFAFSEDSLLRITVLDEPQRVRTRIEGHTTRDFALRDVDFELDSGLGHLHVRGTAGANSLRLRIRTGQDETEQLVPLTQPIYLSSTLRASLQSSSLQPGQELSALVFDPTSLKTEYTRLTIERYEAVPQAGRDVQAWRVREEFRGLRTTAWVDSNGSVLREEGPMGFVLVRETAHQAVNEGWSQTAEADLARQMAVRVARPIHNPRGRRSLRLHVSGVAAKHVLEDAEQQRDGSVVTIRRGDLRETDSYKLPYAGGDHAEDLHASAFLQSDHPRIRSVAHQAIGNEIDAQHAAKRLNDWVYEHLRKVPTVSIPNALQVLEMGAGDCNEHAVLLAALGRAVGLPTRVAAGMVYLDGAFLYHAWSEVWLGRWVSIDPALHQFPADATHIKLVVGEPEEQIAMLDVIGQMQIDVLDDESPSDDPRAVH